MSARSWFNSSIFSCRKFAERMSESYDHKLSAKEKFGYWFHYWWCFTCRRVNKQVERLEHELPKLKKCDKLNHSCLSDECKARIKAKLAPR